MDRPGDKKELRGPGGVLPLRDGDLLGRDLLLLITGETSGRPLEEVLAEFGCSRSAYYEKLRRFRESGTEGLIRRRPGPRKPWRRTHELEIRIVQARLADPERPAAEIAEELNREGLKVSVRSVERTLSEFGLCHGARRGTP